MTDEDEGADEAISPRYGPPGTPAGPERAPAGVAVAAEWWRRLVAVIIDGVILSVPNFVIAGVLGIKTTETDPLTNHVQVRLGSLATLTLISLLVSVVYSGLFEGSAHGQSIGKMAMRIQVRDAELLGPIGFARAAWRRLVYQALFLPFGLPGLINGLSPLWDARRQAWHDKVAHTLVVNTTG